MGVTVCPLRDYAIAYDEGLAERIREQLAGNIYITEKKMFGGVCFLHDGNMLCAVIKDELMLRTGPDPDLYKELLDKPNARPNGRGFARLSTRFT